MNKADQENYKDNAEEGVLTTPDGHTLPRVLDPVVTMTLVQRYVETERSRNRKALLWISGIFLLTVFLVLSIFISISIFVLKNLGQATDIVNGVQAQTAVYTAEMDGILNKISGLSEGNEEIKGLVEKVETVQSKKDLVLRNNLERFGKWISANDKEDEQAILSMKAQLKEISDKTAEMRKELERERTKYRALVESAASPDTDKMTVSSTGMAETVAEKQETPEVSVSAVVSGSSPADVAVTSSSESINTTELSNVAAAAVSPTEDDIAPTEREPGVSSVNNGDGSSVVMLPNGEKYEGGIQDGLFHGWGVYSYANGDKYEGDFERGVKNGKGTFVHDNGDKYTGDFENDMMTGRGIVEFKNGDKYEGEVLNGLMGGKGTIWYSNGNKYIGDFSNGLKQGNGQFSFENGDVYKGGFENDLRNGKGTYIFSDGSKYVGEFKDGKRHGKGSYVYGDGAEYRGDFVDGKKDGEGLYIYPNGKQVKGLWKLDKFSKSIE